MKTDVELISTGSELLSGRTVNRHAQVLGEKLAPLGFRLVQDTTVPDDRARMLEALDAAAKRVDWVFMSGGLGPTHDDLTREIAAEWLGRKVVEDPASLAYIRSRFRQAGRKTGALVERNALIVEGAEALPNHVGAAPGERIDLPGGGMLFLLPGPPREFEAVLSEQVLPRLEALIPNRAALIERVFMAAGIGESDILEAFHAAGFEPRDIELAFCASPGRVEIRLTGRAGDEARIEEYARIIRGLLGAAIFAEERTTLEEVVGRLLRKAGKRLATAESCTGGLVGHKLTSIPGSSDYYLGGVVAYSNQSKVRELAVPKEVIARDGAVSEAVALRMAEGVRERFEADVGLSLTGIAGPGGGTPEKPVGLVYFALADGEGSVVKRQSFSGDRIWIKERAALAALDLLRRRLQDAEARG